MLQGFKEIPDFGGRYLIDECGAIWDSRRGIFLKPSTTMGYHLVCLIRRPTVPVVTGVHRLVLITWGSPVPFDGAVCRHKDGKKNNNHISNLEWGSHADNAKDRDRHGQQVRGDRARSGVRAQRFIPCVVNPVQANPVLNWEF